MRAILKDGMVIISVESEGEAETFAAWRAAAKDHVFQFRSSTDKGGALFDLGPLETACRVPLNIVFDQCAPRWRPISNLALSPFVMRGRPYASIEGFWQGLKLETDDARAQAAGLWGLDAKRIAGSQPDGTPFVYDGATYLSGTHGHRALMVEACRAKFSQNLEARDALLATEDRVLVHRTRGDSKTIPGALMADIWMRIRAKLRDPTGDENLAASDSAEDDGRILFFARDRSRFGFLSHFHPSPIEIDGERWPTVEHYYQTQKSHDPDYRAAIRACATPGDAKQTAARADPSKPSNLKSWFARTGAVPRADWNAVKLDIMRRADLAKYTQNEDLAARLLATGTTEIVEDSPFDSYWGTGKDGTGENWAGRVIMEVREALLGRARSSRQDTAS